jgi:hypothetical protein
MTEPSRSESTRAQIEMAKTLLSALAHAEVIDLRPGTPTLDDLLEALVSCRLRLVRDSQAIAPEALAAEALTAVTPEAGVGSQPA